MLPSSSFGVISIVLSVEKQDTIVYIYILSCLFEICVFCPTDPNNPKTVVYYLQAYCMSSLWNCKKLYCFLI